MKTFNCDPNEKEPAAAIPAKLQQSMAEKKEEEKLTKQPEPAKERTPKEWIKLIEDYMVKEGITPRDLFLASDLNNNGLITIDELKRALFRLFPAKEISMGDIKKIAMVLDVNRNGCIEEEEFL